MIGNNIGLGVVKETDNNVRQEINAKVIGVLRYNNEIREQLLKKNIGVYVKSDIPNIIGYIPNFYALENRKPFSLGKEGLLGHTHLVHSIYQDKIKTKYDIDDVIEYYQSPIEDNASFKWGGNYSHYIEYINKILPTINTNKGIDELLEDNLNYILTPAPISIKANPVSALSGRITTNINPLINTDTKLGVISNKTYATMLKNSAIFNSSRYINYISPNVYEYVGNNLNTIYDLDEKFNINPNTGVLEYNIGSAYSYTTNIENSDLTLIAQTNPLHFNIRQNQKYKPFYGYSYDFISIKNDDYSIVDSDDSDDKSIYNSENKFVKDSLLYKTTSLFTNGTTGSEYKPTIDEVLKGDIDYSVYSQYVHPIDTLIDKYHTEGGSDSTHNKKSLLQSAVTSNFGMSHGRNLLSKNPTNPNPYCRVWIKSNKYDQVDKLISFRTQKNKDGVNDKLIEYLERVEGSTLRLKNNSSLNSNGYVNITPTTTLINKDRTVINTKNYMFSIENLAWKGYANENLTPEQIGPNGGRIMWFPPYGLKFNENLSASWSSNDFIGRGEKIYTYTNSERTGTLSFILLVDHPSILDVWRNNSIETDVNTKEDEVLRYMVGCDMLNIKEHKDNERLEILENEQEEEENIMEDNPDIIFYVYFPNNYSGKQLENKKDLYYAICEYFKYDQQENVTQIITEGGKWCYPVDDDLSGEKLSEENYKDLNPLSLNFKKTEDATHSFQEFNNNIKSSINVDDYEISATGSASSHGKKPNNDELSKNRCKTVMEYLGVNVDENNINTIITPVGTVDKDNISGESAKRGRFVKVVMKNKTKSESEKKYDAIKEDINQIKTRRKKTYHGLEAQYFSMLQETDNILYKKIVEKIKYFTPAFHSITPEGFNARLAFLNQCTRQGLTCATSDGNILGRAGNMAFGRPPVCVLRIGDFYHTKIIIDSITINYGETQWDMNADGIGLQPIYADITFNFKFLGGSDIEGPIAKLQNAISFNYYANQSIYDKRADTKYTKWYPDKNNEL